MLGFGPDGVLPWAVPPAAFETGGPLLRPVLVAGGRPRAAVPLLALLAADAGLVPALPAPVPLVLADALGADVAVTRAHTPGTATSAERDAGGTYVEIAQNLPRFAFASRRLRVERGTENSIRNPAGDGATPGVIGGGGAYPTNVSTPSPPSSRGLTATVGAASTRGGLRGRSYTFSGTASSGGIFQIAFESSTQIVVTPGQQVASTVFLEAIGGTFNGVTLVQFQTTSRTAAGSFVAVNALSIPTADLASFARYGGPVTLNAGGTVARCNNGLSFTVTNGAMVNFEIWIAGAQIELDATAVGSPMYPVSGTPAAASRAIDVPVWAPSAFPARGCILLTGTLDALAGASALGLLQLDDGTDSNRIVARVAAGGGVASADVVVGGVTTATLAPGATLAAGVQSKLLLAWSPGGVRFGVAGVGVASVATARPAGLVRGLLGHAAAAGTLPMGGELLAEFRPIWPSEAEAAALLAA